MDKLILENIRCFGDRQEVSLKPLTLLVGENSTGKTTFLAIYRIATQLASMIMQPDFAEEPFDLGAYDQIAHLRGGPVARADSFTIGFEYSEPRLRNPIRMTMTNTFAKQEAQPQRIAWSVVSGDYIIEAQLVNDTDGWEIVASRGKASKSAMASSGLPEGFTVLSKHWLPLNHYRMLSWRPMFEDYPEKGTETVLGQDDMFQMQDILEAPMMAFAGSVRCRAFAPLRSAPKRTYDPIREIPEPSGRHVPMVLARLSIANKAQWRELKEAIEKFGQASGLFKRIEVTRLGKSDSDPFQVRLRVRAPQVNLIDVGYGVSQTLPLVVDCLLEEPGTTFLMQQPEVHLHPRAQAELGTFLGTLAKTQRKRFLVETHSDYLIDRVRMDVRDGSVDAKDVTILYFQWEGPSVIIHEISIDKRGNIVNAPPGYREFFLEEERRFFEG